MMLKVMVVDDNEVNTMILANMLELFNIHVDQANFGIQAVNMFQSAAYDIIFIDHIMPVMDGLQTTTAIRSISSKHQNTIIIALTSNVTDVIKTLYKEAGANAVYAKPLGLMELISILKEWCPELPTDSIPTVEETDDFQKNNEIIKIIMNEIKEINYFAGLKYAIGNPVHYINILEVSLLDMSHCILNICKSNENKSLEELKVGLHKIKSILTNIGAIELSEEAKLIEANILHSEISSAIFHCTQFARHVENLKGKLYCALEKYNGTKQLEKKEQQLVNIPMSEKEYEQSLLNTIYYIKRFEYDAIIKELEKLIFRGLPDFKLEFEWILLEIKEYHYEKALIRIMNIKMR
jgi:CheY-like chemotaxis protein